MPATVVTRGKLWGRSFYGWRKQRFYPLDYQGYKWAPLPGAEEVINREIAPLCVTLRDDELPQLPELSVIFDRVVLPPRRPSSSTMTCSSKLMARRRRRCRPGGLGGRRDR